MLIIDGSLLGEVLAPLSAASLTLFLFSMLRVIQKSTVHDSSSTT